MSAAPENVSRIESQPLTPGTENDLRLSAEGSLLQLAHKTSSEQPQTELEGVTDESIKSLRGLEFLDQLPEQDKLYDKPQVLASGEKGTQSNNKGNDLYVQIVQTKDANGTDVMFAQVSSEASKDAQGVFQLVSINGAKDGFMTCTVRDTQGQISHVEIPRTLVYQSQILAEKDNILAGIKDPAQKKVVEAYIASLEHPDQTPNVDADTQKAIETVGAQVGLLKRESLVQYVTNQTQLTDAEKQALTAEIGTDGTFVTADQLSNILSKTINKETFTPIRDQLQAKLEPLNLQLRDIEQKLQTDPDNVQLQQQAAQLRTQIGQIEPVLKNWDVIQGEAGNPTAVAGVVRSAYENITRGRIPNVAIQDIESSLESGDSTKLFKRLLEASADDPDAQEKIKKYEGVFKMLSENNYLKGAGIIGIYVLLLAVKAAENAASNK